MTASDKSPFDLVVSLGGNCQVAYRTRDTVPTKSGPFDWLITPFGGLVRALRRDFDGFMHPDGLWRYDGAGHGHVVFDTGYGLLSLHDFTENTPLTNADVQEKYRHLVDNFRRVLAGPERVLFVRSRIRRHEAEELTGLIGARRPSLPWGLLALTSTPEDPWGIPRVTNTFLKPTDRWQGDEAAWAKLLAPFHSEGARNDRRPVGRTRPRAG